MDHLRHRTIFRAHVFGALVPLASFGLGAFALARVVSPRAVAASPVLTAAVADTQHLAIKVTGMFCESCEATVRAMLKRSVGVYSAVVDVKRGLATVTYDPQKTTPAALADVINRLGYKATLPSIKAKASG